MSQYLASVPADGLVKPEIRSYFERFYKISDTPDGHEAYADMFTKAAKLVMISNVATGRDEIVKLRHGMWEKVASRSHKPFQLFPFGAASDEVMVYGTVELVFKDGRKTTVDWAARSHFTSEDDELKMDFYQVYLDSAAMAKAR